MYPKSKITVDVGVSNVWRMRLHSIGIRKLNILIVSRPYIDCSFAIERVLGD